MRLPYSHPERASAREVDGKRSRAQSDGWPAPRLPPPELGRCRVKLVPQVRPSFGLTWVGAGAWKLNRSGQPETVVSEYSAVQREPPPRLASKRWTRTWGTRHQASIRMWGYAYSIDNQSSVAIMNHLTRHKCHAEAGQRFTAANRRYEFRGLLGNGAVGIVRKAEDLETGRFVAVKLLAPDPKYIDVKAFADVEQRFKREGLRGAHLRDDSLIEIVSYEENINGSCFQDRAVCNPFIVMEYVRGRTLESFIRKIGFSAGTGTRVNFQTLTIAKRIATALCYLHEYKVIHRDVKPANVFLSTTDERHVPTSVKLGDFGVTKWGDFRASAVSGTLTVTKQQGLGTLKYMSPEQAVRPKDITVRSDIFSLGITLFELFTGRILESPHHIFEVMMARNNRESVMGKMLSLGIKPSYEELDLFQLVLDMFLGNPKGRPASVTVAGRLATMLERCGN